MLGEVFALYDDLDAALDGLEALASAGVRPSAVSLVAHDGVDPARVRAAGARLPDLRTLEIRGAGHVLAAGPVADTLELVDRLRLALTAHELPWDHAQRAAEAVRGGGALLLLEVEEDAVKPASDALARTPTREVEVRRRARRSAGPQTRDPDAPGYSLKELEAQVQQDLPYETRREEEDHVHDRERVAFMRAQVKYGRRPAGQSGVGDEPPARGSTSRDRYVLGRRDVGPRTFTRRKKEG